jgi:hypothetical protein
MAIDVRAHEDFHRCILPGSVLCTVLDWLRVSSPTLQNELTLRYFIELPRRSIAAPGAHILGETGQCDTTMSETYMVNKTNFKPRITYLSPPHFPPAPCYITVLICCHASIYPFVHLSYTSTHSVILTILASSCCPEIINFRSDGMGLAA